ncbi:lipase class 3 family protein [Crucibulum laeve]|uniref:Lipase class 3 family protein n=1 Tax=Crucibulum laeve TaxID=68775 RepID=A0A5C3M342_9AGAR|nr:lipase class 3 family protein [Crucibulum laeve]
MASFFSSSYSLLSPRRLAQILLLGALTFPKVQSLPLAPNLLPRQSITALSTTQIAAFRPFSHYASTAYCQPSQTLTWSCGANCDANPTFEPTASGGDGSSVQFWYVGFDPTLQTVIVAHQGTDPSKIQSLLTDGDFFLDNLDSTLFPGVSSDIKVHNGFADEHAKTATSILAAVQTTMQKHSTNDITIVGHSLGAALALLEGVYLPLFIPGAKFTTIGYGMPRVGNAAFADYVDSHVTLTHVNNLQDLVPTLPGRFLGFTHANGEKHIQPDLSWLDCPGHDNTDSRCIVGDVSNIFEGDISNHDGPYDTVTMGC